MKQFVKWTAEGAWKRTRGKRAEYIATCGHTSVAGDMLVSRQVHGVISVNQGGTADNSAAGIVFIRP